MYYNNNDTRKNHSMNTLILKDLVKDSSSNEQGTVLFESLKVAYLSGTTVVLQVDDLAMSSSFLNTSIGQFLENYGFDSFRKTVKFKGSKSQFLRLSNYIEKYKNLYLV